MNSASFIQKKEFVVSTSKVSINKFSKTKGLFWEIKNEAFIEPYNITNNIDKLIEIYFLNYYLETSKNQALSQNQIANSYLEKLKAEHQELYYVNLSNDWVSEQKFTLPLSQLIIYFSYINFGGVLNCFLNSLPEQTPLKKGDEKRWVYYYLVAMQTMLQTTNNLMQSKPHFMIAYFMAQVKSNKWK
jgi:hypothetical protein